MCPLIVSSESGKYLWSVLARLWSFLSAPLVGKFLLWGNPQLHDTRGKSGVSLGGRIPCLLPPRGIVVVPWCFFRLGSWGIGVVSKVLWSYILGLRGHRVCLPSLWWCYHRRSPPLRHVWPLYILHRQVLLGWQELNAFPGWYLSPSLCCGCCVLGASLWLLWPCDDMETFIFSWVLGRCRWSTACLLQGLHLTLLPSQVFLHSVSVCWVACCVPSVLQICWLGCCCWEGLTFLAPDQKLSPPMQFVIVAAVNAQSCCGGVFSFSSSFAWTWQARGDQ